MPSAWFAIMHPNLTGLFSAALSVVVFYFAHSRLITLGFRTRLIVLLISGLLSAPAFAFALYYLHVLPEKRWFYELRSWNGSELLISFAGVFFAAIAAMLPRQLLIAPLLVLAAIAVVPFVKPISGPLADESFQDKWKDDVCMQSTPSTCGPASVATILNSLGKRIPERQIAREAYSCSTGTEAWYLARYIRSAGFRAEFKFTEGLSSAVPLPAMAGVSIGSFGHFIPILRKDGDMFEIADPMKGKQMLSIQQLQKRYHFTGFYLTVGNQ